MGVAVAGHPTGVNQAQPLPGDSAADLGLPGLGEVLDGLRALAELDMAAVVAGRPRLRLVVKLAQSVRASAS